jgi:hypothetical protein
MHAVPARQQQKSQLPRSLQATLHNERTPNTQLSSCA